MAKFIKTFENGEVKNELTFRGNTYDFTMSAEQNGRRKSDKKCFSCQIEENEDIDWEEEDIDINMIDCVNEDEVIEILEQLEELEE